jgi:hypothetical protein
MSTVIAILHSIIKYYAKGLDLLLDLTMKIKPGYHYYLHSFLLQ